MFWMKQVFFLIQIILGILLILVIIIQQKGGGGLGSAFGADLGFYRTRRGAEKMLFYATIVLSCAFLISAIIGLAI